MVLPAGLVEVTVRREGAAGQDWLDSLPSAVAQFGDRWGRDTNGAPWHGDVALVLPVSRASEAAALKISFPYSGHRGEADALRCFNRHGAARLLMAVDSASNDGGVARRRVEPCHEPGLRQQIGAAGLTGDPHDDVAGEPHVVGLTVLDTFHGDVSPETQPGDERRATDRVLAWHAADSSGGWTSRSRPATNDCEVYG